MKKTAIACLVAAAAMTFGSVSFAQGRDGPQGRNGPNNGHQAQQRPDNRPGNHPGGPDHRNDRANDRNDHRGGPQYSHNARGGEWRRGGRVPQEYRNPTYRVNDWRGHRLSAPPRGHQWVQVGGDYVLMAVATGVIVQLMLNN